MLKFQQILLKRCLYRSSWTLGVYTAGDTHRFDARNATPQAMDGAYDSLKIRTTITDATDNVKITKFNGASVLAFTQNVGLRWR
ncbi:hypothetical protein B0F87_101451 [Methylobacter tundripaludum]|uniref:Uncharacterized protein n=1 Tax=Methylobacter tundripaludum TaxID=173365 RepID=A0A2S6HKQ2_9GAMM|nr:hypothetical protein [Methylobacter tundripaludum]PPK78069.1 hypothetical protein B0F87_101451 [Methylobacter tundripaludum]